MEIPPGFNLREHVKDLERKLIYAALSKTLWQKSAASRLLGMNRTTMVEKMRRLGMPLHSAYKQQQKKEEPNGRNES